jgi:hemolysin activation/secretion protein
VVISDGLRVLFARAHASANGVVFDRPWEGAVDLELRKGLDILNASQQDETQLSHTNANPEAFVTRLGGHLSYRAGPLVEVYGAVTLQDSDSRVLSFEQLAIGNLTYGRGYDPSAVSGDQGIAGSVELRIGPFSPIPGLAIGGYTFFDAAYTKVVGFEQPGVTVRSVGVGVRASYQDKYDLDISYAKPLNPVSSNALIPPPERALITLTARY